MKIPSIHPTAFIHPAAHVMGEVTLAEHVSIWPGSVLRGDINRITIGAYTNIQELTLCHVDDDAPCTIGAYVVCGHQATLHGCTVADRCLIGIAAAVLSHVVIGPDTIIGAHSLVPEGKQLEGGYVYYGSPVKKVRRVTDQERAYIRQNAERYAAGIEAYRRGEIQSARPSSMGAS